MQRVDESARDRSPVGSDDQAFDLQSGREGSAAHIDLAFAPGNLDTCRCAARELTVIDGQLVAAGSDGGELEHSIYVGRGCQAGVVVQHGATPWIPARRQQDDARRVHRPPIRIDHLAPGAVTPVENDVEGFGSG